MDRGLKHFILAVMTILLGLQVSCKTQQNIPALERKVSMPVFKAERLESVMMRLAMNTGRRFDVQVLTISGTVAKEADYKDVPMRVILEEQLAGTPFAYRLNKDELKIYKK